MKLERELENLPNLHSNSQYIPTDLKHISITNQIKDIYYNNDQDGRITSNYWGAAGVLSDELDSLSNINSLKLEFQKSVIKLRNQSQTNWLNTYKNINQRENTLSKTLKDSDLSRLHLKQTYRQIPILKSQPLKIAFSWYTSGRSIKRISKQDVLKKLIAIGEDKPHIQIQIQQLSKVNDLYFAQIQKQAPTIRANILYADNQTQSFNASLPIFYELDKEKPKPIITELPKLATNLRTRAVRSDNRIEEDCFLKSLRVHRYI